MVLCQLLFKCRECLLSALALIAATAFGEINQALSVGLSTRVILLDVPRHPAFNWRAGVGPLDDTYRYLEFFMQFLSKIIGNCRSLGSGLSITSFPATQTIAVFRQWLVPMFTSRFKNAQMWQIDLTLFLRLEGISHRPPHIRLPHTQPDLPNSDILDLNLV